MSSENVYRDEVVVPTTLKLPAKKTMLRRITTDGFEKNEPIRRRELIGGIQILVLFRGIS